MNDVDKAVRLVAEEMLAAFIDQGEYVHRHDDELRMVTLDGYFDLEKAAERILNALAAGAQSAETNVDLAQSEGRQSGGEAATPKGSSHDQ